MEQQCLTLHPHFQVVRTKLRIHLLLLFSLFFWTGLEAQTCSISLNNADSLEFSLFLGGKPVLEKTRESVSLDSLSCASLLIDLFVHDSTGTYLRTDLELDTAWTPQLALVNDSNIVTLQLLNPRAVRDYVSLPQNASMELAVNRMEVSTVNCFPPSTPDEVQSILSQLDQLDFERQRIGLLEREIPKLCLTTDQIQALIETIDDESKRLSLLRIAHPHCYNKADYSSLVNLLYLERSIKSFKNEILSQD